MTDTPGEPIQTDLTIIGSGTAGSAAAIFAAQKGIKTYLTGKNSSIHFASGLLDLMGCIPGRGEWDDPWSAIQTLRQEVPGHPYTKIEDRDIQDAMTEFFNFLKANDIAYERKSLKNVNVITSLGTLKKSYMIPETMWNGVKALELKAPTLIVGIKGLKLFSARQIASCLSSDWPDMRHTTLEFPGMECREETFAEQMAWALDLEEYCKSLAERIYPYVKDAQFIGLPAILGMASSKKTCHIMEKFLKKPVFEIPTPPVSVPGMRLKNSLAMGFQKNELLHSLPEMVQDVEILSDGGFRLQIGKDENEKSIVTKGLILATGRFLGKGLTAERAGIRESLMELPVFQPDDRQGWHKKDLFHPMGHPVNQAGIETDHLFRPLTSTSTHLTSTPLADNFYAVGSILAHSDWMRLKCGSGVALASAFAAVKAFKKGI